jgi:regulatory protein
MLRRRSRKPGSDGAATHPQAVRLASLALLAKRDFAAGELRERLRAQGFGDDAVAAAIAELTTEGVLDDERYAHNYVAYHAGRGQGPVRIAAALRQCGVDAALIAAALASGPDWRALARQVCRAKFGAQPAASWAQKARRARFLQYRGFSADHIRAATGVDAGPD